MSAPRILDQGYLSSSSAEMGSPAPKSPTGSPRPGVSSRPSSPKQGPNVPFNAMSEREQVRHLWGSRRRKSKKTRKVTKKRRSTRRK
jgi:hypothetical protein